MPTSLIMNVCRKTVVPGLRLLAVRVSFFLFVSSLLLSGGCSNLNCTRLEVLLGGDVDLVHLGTEIADSLIRQSFPPLLPRQPERPVLVTTLVDNTDLHMSSDFGRILQNNIASGFVAQGFVINETRLRRDLLVKPGEGEFMLSRSLADLAERQRAQAVVVGTYTLARRVMYLSVRLVRPGDRTVLASWNRRLCLDENTLHLLGLQFNDIDEVTPPSESFLDRILY